MRVRYIGATTDQVNWGGNDDPRGLLREGDVYVVAKRDVHSWHTKIELAEFSGKRFNDASFEYVEESGAAGTQEA